MVIIKKYGNRRLYDSARSRYINLEELAAIIRAGEAVQVVDAKTNEDLTHEVLMQVVLTNKVAVHISKTMLSMLSSKK